MLFFLTGNFTAVLDEAGAKLSEVISRLPNLPSLIPEMIEKRKIKKKEKKKKKVITTEEDQEGEPTHKKKRGSGGDSSAQNAYTPGIQFRSDISLQACSSDTAIPLEAVNLPQTSTPPIPGQQITAFTMPPSLVPSGSQGFDFCAWNAEVSRNRETTLKIFKTGVVARTRLFELQDSYKSLQESASRILAKDLQREITDQELQSRSDALAVKLNNLEREQTAWERLAQKARDEYRSLHVALRWTRQVSRSRSTQLQAYKDKVSELEKTLTLIGHQREELSAQISRMETRLTQSETLSESRRVELEAALEREKAISPGILLDPIQVEETFMTEPFMEPARHRAMDAVLQSFHASLSEFAMKGISMEAAARMSLLEFASEMCRRVPKEKEDLGVTSSAPSATPS